MTRRDRRHPLVPAALAACAALACIATTPPARAHKPVTSRYNFAEHVLPVLARRCLACHRPGGPGPMSLASYEEARPWAEALKDAVLERSMPPWYAEAGFTPLAGENALSARELDIISEWASGGAPAGPPGPSGRNEPATAPGPPAAVLEAACEEKTIVLPEVEVGAAAARPSSFRVPLDLESDRYLAGWTLEPGNGALVRAAALRILPPAAGGTRAGEDTLVPAGTWTAAAPSFFWQDGAALKVPRGSILVVDLVHGRGFRSAGKAARDRSTLLLRFLCALPARELRVVWLGGEHASLAPGAEAVACFPGEAGTGSLLLREGSAPPKVLLDAFHADRAWPAGYRFAAPVPLAAAARLEWVPGPGRAALLYSVPRA